MLGEDASGASAERVARNDAAFREANDRINDVAESFDRPDGELLPFLCECADVRCTEILRLTPSEYEAVRREPTRFLNAQGHVRNAEGWARVVEEFDRYTVVEKIGEAGEIAAELDARPERHP
jgi:hypothetical protein